MTQTIYAIGDIHGDLDQLLEAHNRISTDLDSRKIEDYKIVHVGDLVDRQPDSKGVLDHMISGHERGEPWVTLKGNHDRLFLWFLEDAERKDPVLRPDYTWLHPRMGGRDTLRSYGVEVPENYDLKALEKEAQAAVPVAHRSFLESLPNSLETRHFFFVHAGIRPDVPLTQQVEDDLIWIRNDFLDDTREHPKIIVHGHTPVEDVTHYGNRINIDTGAAWGEKLSTIVIEGTEVSLLDGSGRVPLIPQS